MNNKRIITLVFAAGFALAASAGLVRAATLGVSAPASLPAVGQPFHVDVGLDTEGADANAIQAQVVFPPSLFSFSGVIDGSSPVSLWIQAPVLTAPGVVSFSGIMPGGFTGEASSVVEVVLTPITPGAATVGITNAELLADDGQGTAIPLTTTNTTIAVVTIANASGTSTGATSTFTVPGPFTPIVSHDSNVYGGKYFLAFSATDKGSGIDHYEVLEAPAGTKLGSNEPWVTTATSPYLLQDQSLSSDIYVKAVNHTGNATIEKVPARFPSKGISSLSSAATSWGWVVGVIIPIVIGAWIVRRRRTIKV